MGPVLTIPRIGLKHIRRGRASAAEDHIWRCISNRHAGICAIEAHRHLRKIARKDEPKRSAADQNMLCMHARVGCPTPSAILQGILEEMGESPVDGGKSWQKGVGWQDCPQQYGAGQHSLSDSGWSAGNWRGPGRL